MTLHKETWLGRGINKVWRNEELGHFKTTTAQSVQWTFLSYHPCGPRVSLDDCVKMMRCRRKWLRRTDPFLHSCWWPGAKTHNLCHYNLQPFNLLTRLNWSGPAVSSSPLIKTRSIWLWTVRVASLSLSSPTISFFWQAKMKQKADIWSHWNCRPCNLEISILSRVISSLRFLSLNLIQVGAKTNSNHL